jgi:hypothetical protein
MKRTVTLTAALMFAGMTSLGLANENMNANKPAPSMESKPAASMAPAEVKPMANVESAKQPVASNSKNEVLPSKEGTASQKVIPGSPAIVEKTEKKDTSSMTATPNSKVTQGSSAVTEKTEKKETSSVTATPDSKEKQIEHKSHETHTTTNPTK